MFRKRGRSGGHFSSSDGVFRIGGDEFAAILPDATASQALRYVQRLQAQLGEARATAGICELSDDITREDLIHHADQALLEAKREYRDALIHTASLQPAEPSDRRIEDRLAVDNTVAGPFQP